MGVVFASSLLNVAPWKRLGGLVCVMAVVFAPQLFHLVPERVVQMLPVWLRFELTAQLFWFGTGLAALFGLTLVCGAPFCVVRPIMVLGFCAASAVSVLPAVMPTNQKWWGLLSVATLVMGASLFRLLHERSYGQEWHASMKDLPGSPWVVLPAVMLPCVLGDALWVAWGAGGGHLLTIPIFGFFLSAIGVLFLDILRKSA